MRISLISSFASLASLLLGTPHAGAQDASLGCKVLLCAAAPAPGWPSIPYCVAPMQQVLSMVAQGGAWPPCQQASNAAPNVSIQPFLDCATGATAVSIPPGSTYYAADPNGQSCASTQDLTKYLSDIVTVTGAGVGSVPPLPITPRPANPNPITVTLDLGGTQSQQSFAAPQP